MPEEIPVLTVRDLKALETADNGRPFSAVLVVRKLQAKTASNGNTYHSVDLGDRGGVFSCTVFGDSPVSETLRAVGEGAVIRIEGKVEFYQGRFSPRLQRATALDEEALAAPGVL
ncbi:MAG: OB-fold nucleic acid binding domain-containing protein, partial [Opitutaceae bacterium]